MIVSCVKGINLQISVQILFIRKKNQSVLSVMASPNQQSGSRGNKEDDARPDDDNKALDEKQKAAMIQVIKQELKNHKQARLQAKKEKKALKKETKNQEDIAAGMVTPGRVPSELVPPTCPRERPKTPLPPGPIKPNPSASSSSRPLP